MVKRRRNFDATIKTKNGDEYSFQGTDCDIEKSIPAWIGIHKDNTVVETIVCNDLSIKKIGDKHPRPTATTRITRKNYMITVMVVTAFLGAVASTVISSLMETLPIPSWGIFLITVSIFTVFAIVIYLFVLRSNSQDGN